MATSNSTPISTTLTDTTKAEIGAAWKATSKAGNPYISVKLDDPSFPAPIFCRLVESEKGHSLIWTR